MAKKLRVMICANCGATTMVDSTASYPSVTDGEARPSAADPAGSTPRPDVEHCGQCGAAELRDEGGTSLPVA